MSENNRKESSWPFPPDLAVLLGSYYILLPAAFLSEWVGTHLYNAKNTGDSVLFWIAIALGAIGTALLFFARLPLYRQRRFLTFGPGELDDKHRRLYRWAYRFIGVSVLLLLAMLIWVLG